MATQQTGLGWYADDAWLMNQAGEIGRIGVSSGVTQLPYATSAADAPVVGINRYGDRPIKMWTNSPTSVAKMYVTSYTRPSTRWIISNTYMAQYDNLVCYDLAGQSGTVTVSNQYRYSDEVLLFYHVQNIDWDDFYPETGYFGLASSLEDAAEQFMTEAATVFEKTLDGYSVACFCEWNAVENGDVYISPVLISSEQNNTIYRRDSSIPSVPTTEHEYQGMTFYMRKAPLDIFNPASTITTDYSIVVLTDLSRGITNNEIFNAIRLASGLGVGYPPQNPDPYGPGGTSEPGISEGTFDETSDIIVDSNTPTYSFSGTGFSRIYNPSLAQLRSLASYLWTDTTFLQTIINHGKQLLENPMEAIISLSLLPCNIPHSTTAEEVKVMYVGTGVNMYPATTQFVDVDCGTLLIDKFYDSALDFNPYTTVSLFLPFIGMVDLDADEVMGRYLQVKYRVDIISGACVAKVFVSDEDGISYSCRYQFNGDCAVSMPLNSADFSGYRAAFIAAATAVTMGTMAAAGGVGGMLDAAMSGGVETSSSPEIAETASTALTVVPRGGALQERATTAFSEPSRNAAFVDSVNKIADVVAGSMANLVSTVMGGKMHFQHASGFGGNAGMLGIRRPFVVIKRPRMCNPDEYGVYNGRPCQMYLSLATISGFTQVGNVHLTGIPATIPELNEIAGFLKSGVIL